MISKLISLHTARFNWVSVKIVSGFLILYLCKVYLQQCFGKHQRTYNQEGQEKKKKRKERGKKDAHIISFFSQCLVAIAFQ